MKKTNLFLFLLLCVPGFVWAQLNITASNDAMQLANQLGGSGLNVISATLNCPNNAAGVFSNGNNSDIGIGTGVILTTGVVTDLVSGSGSDASVFINEDNGGPSMPNLEPLASNTTFNGCVLSMQVKPICNNLSISYVFASEEYSDQVNSSYNDVFAFFISGPTPGGGNYTNQNIALVPGTSQPVSINTINYGQSLVGIAPTGPGVNSQYYVDNTNGTLNNYDGSTTRLNASIAVEPCETYTINFEIADVGDGKYDSGVFLEANSVSCPINNTSTTVSDTICTGQFANVSSSVPVGGAGTYSWSTGQIGHTVSVYPSNDSTYICYYTYCGVSVTDTVNVVVTDSVGSSFNYGQNVFCDGTLSAIPTVVGTGIFSGSVGLVIDSISGEILIDSTGVGVYTVSFASNGYCPSPLTQDITIQTSPNATISGNSTLCAGDSAAININLTGSAPFSFNIVNTVTNDTSTYISNQNTYTLYVDTTGTFIISSLNDQGCPGNASGNATVTIKPKPSASFSGGSNFCVGYGSTPIVVNLTGTQPFVLSYTENGLPVTQTINSNTYTYTPTGPVNLEFLALNDAGTCLDSLNQDYNIVQNPSPVISILNEDTICNGNNTLIVASGADTYTWLPSNTLNISNNDSVVASPLANTIYTVIGVNLFGCVDTAFTSLFIDNSINASFEYLPNEPTTLDSVIFSNSSVSEPLIYSWNFGDNSTPSVIENPSHLYTEEGEYNVVLTVTNNRGCYDTVSHKVVVKDKYLLEIPNIFTPDGDGSNDQFKFIKALGISDLHCEIYNRWGKKVFEFNGANGHWDGLDNGGSKCHDGVYYYIVTLTNNINESKEFNGYVTLKQ